MHVSRILIDIHLDNLDQFINTVHQNLEQGKAEFTKEIDARAKKLSPSDRDDLYDFYRDDYWLLDEEFPNILWNSVLISMYSVVDLELTRLCNSLQTKHSARKALSDRRKGTLLRKIEQYLTLDLSLSFPSSSADWTELNSIATVRNCVVHNGSQIKGKKDKELRRYICAHSTLSIDQLDRVVVSEQYCRDSMTAIKRFVKDLFENHLR